MIAFIARQIRRLIALIALAAMLIGAPYALYKLGGPLLPDHVPGLAEIWQRLTERDTGQVFLGFLVIVGFVAWAIFAITVLLEIAARIAHRPDWHLPGLHLPQTAAGLLVGMIIAGTITASAAPAIAAGMPLLPHPAPVAVATAPFHAASPAVRHGEAGMTTRAAAPIHTATPTPGAGPTWTVSKGDSLWSIAEKTLGSGRRFHEIEVLNQGRIQPDGRTLDSANFLLAGWVLQLPTDAHIPAGESGSQIAGGGIPGRSTVEAVVVEPGDTLSQIALDELGDATLYPEIAAANHITNPDLIYPGQTIHIPAPELAPAISSGSSTPAASSEGGPTGGVPATTAGHTRTAGDQAPGATEPVADGAEPGATAQTGDHGTGSSAPQSTSGRSETEPAQPSQEPRESSTTPGSPEKVQVGSAETERLKPAAGDESESSSRHAALLAGATALLAAIAWAGLIATRQRLARRRLPGQSPEPLTAEEAQVERAMRERAKAVAPQRLNAALRSISGLLAEHAPSGVDLLLIGGDDIEVRPTMPAPPPAPFTGTHDAWLLDLPDIDEVRGDDPSLDESSGDETLSALPGLVTLGTLNDGRIAAVDVEHLGALSLTGDPDRCRQLANHIVLELSQSPWTDGVHVSVDGISESASALEADRIQAVENLEAATQFIRYQADHTRELLGDEPIAHARTETTYADAWEPHIVIADAKDLAEKPGIDGLIETLERGPAAAAAIIAIGDSVGIQMSVTVDQNGHLHLPHPGSIEGITAASVSDSELAAITGLFSKQNVDSAPVGEQTLTDLSSGAKAEVEDDEADKDEPRRNEATVTQTPNAPQPLDADIAEWFSDKPSRPRIAILGDAHVDGLGVLPDRPIARMTEYAVYLALHPAGVSADKFVTDLWPENRQPSDSTRRADVSRLRAWLGLRAPNDPFLPTMSGRYQLTDRLVDAELFAKLRARAMVHAQRGDARAAMADYQTALRLVRGPALPEAGGPGYAWLSNVDRMEDRILPTQIVDAAHSLVEIALTVGAVPDAEAAAALGRIADPYSSIPLCDMVRISLAQDDRETARAWADVMLTLNGVDLPADLPEPCGDIVAELYRATAHSAHTRAAP